MDKVVRISLALAVLVIAIALAPQTQAQTSAVEGFVTDSGGAVLEGATVTVTNPSTGLERTATTGTDGRYKIAALPPSTYRIVASKGDLVSPIFEEVFPIGQTVRRDLQMQTTRTEEVQVSSRPLLNSTDTEVAAVVSTRDIETLPLLNRDFTDLANIAPGVKPKATGQLDPTKNEGIYRPFTSGTSNGRDINLQIDGGDNNDNAVGTWTQGYTAEAIQEFEIITDQYKAEYGRATAGVVNVITKSGTNEIDGTVLGLFRNDSFRTENFSEVLAGSSKDESERTQLAFSVGGPIVKDKFFWFAAYENVEETSPVGFSPDLTQYARTSSLAGGSFDTGLERDLYTIKLSGNPAQNNTFYVRYAVDDNEFMNDQGGALTSPENNGSSINEAWSAIGNWTWVGTGLLNELTLHANDFENGIASNASGFDLITVEGYDLITLGANVNTPQATLIAKNQLRNDFSWTVGDHDLKAGVEWLEVEFDDSNLGPPFPRVQFGFRTGVTPDDVDAAPGNLALLQTIGFQNPSLIPGYDYNQLGLYVQDTWTPNNFWTFNFGVRLDKDSGVFDLLRTGTNKEFYEAARTGVPDRFERTLPEDPSEISPRLGAVYRFNGEDKNVIRASYGVFYDKVIENLTIFGAENLSPVAFPGLPTGIQCTDAGGALTGNCAAGADPDAGGPLAPFPSDFTYANWAADVASNGPLKVWYDDLVSSLTTPPTYPAVIIVPSPDWEWPRKETFSIGWGHRFNAEWALDMNFVSSKGTNQPRLFDMRSDAILGVNTGLDPAAAGTVLEIFFETDGKSDYKSLQSQLRGRMRNLDLVLNLNLSRAEATQDLGASADESGTLDIFSGGNRRYVGPSPSLNPACNTPGGPICVTEDQEWGPISGDQFIWASIYAAYRLPLGFVISGDMAYGSEIAFWPNAGYDWNNDGINSGSEYVGQAGSGRGDDFFAMNVRGAKSFDLGRDISLEAFLEVFNLTNQVNYGLYVDQRQADSAGIANSNYGQPTGNFLGTPRTFNIGARLRF